MAREERDWRGELVLAYPDLFHPASDPPPVRTLPDVADGWRDLLERVCARMQAALQQGETIRIIQVDKKSGTLRVYWRGDVTPQTAARLHEAIALAKARSTCTCESCGAEGQLCFVGSVYMIRCAAHVQGELIPTPSGRENVHLVRVSMADGYRIVARRYDRVADRFADEDPAVRETRRPETAVTADWRIDLMQAHPKLFAIIQSKPQASFGYPSCEAGWHDVLDQLCRRIEAALAHNETFKFARIGTKLGLLWIKWEGEVSGESRAKIEEAISLALQRASWTCDICGLERSVAAAC
ncbi:hypothetical protein [Bradyrhizobium sp. DASA03007]|uniref:hypothetical protein n=1 Tax=unclassified Bradyrhizobium TaxID=2631580 RepID=UPI003F6FA85D